MKDRQPTYPGRVKLVDVETGEEKVYDLAMADEPTEAGDPPTKATLLKDATAALFGLGADAVPDDVLAKISEMFSSSSISHAIGDFTSSVTLPFTPDSVWVSSKNNVNGSYVNSAMLYPNVPSYFRVSSSATDRVTWNGSTKISRSGGSAAIRYVAIKFGGNA